MFRHCLTFILLASLCSAVMLSSGESVELGEGYEVVLDSVSGGYGVFDVFSGEKLIASPAVKSGRTHSVKDGSHEVSISVLKVEDKSVDADVSLKETEDATEEEKACQGEMLTAGESLSVDRYSVSLERVDGSYASFSVYRDDSLFASPVIKHGRSWKKEDGDDEISLSLCPSPSCENCAVLEDYSASSSFSEIAVKMYSGENSKSSGSDSGKSGKSSKKSKKPEPLPPPYFAEGKVLRRGNIFDIDERYSVKVINFAYGNSVQLAVLDNENVVDYFYLSFNSTERTDLGNNILEISSQGGDVPGGWVHLVAGKIEADGVECTDFRNGDKIDVGNGYSLSLSSFIGPYAYFTVSHNGLSFDTVAVSYKSPFSREIGINQLDISVCSVDKESRSAKAVASLSG